MSFTGEVKTEIVNLKTDQTEKITELSAIIHNSEVSSSEIRICTENNFLIRHIFTLIKDVLEITPKVIVRKGYNYKKNYIYMLQINKNCVSSLKILGIYRNDKILKIPQSFIVDDESLIRQYIKGTFLMCGSINDPKKSRYHLEFLVSNKEFATFLSYLLNRYNFNSKIIKRDNKYMIYMKEAEKIGDFLRLLNATKSLLYYEDIRIYRDHKNMTNRLNNCEQANVEKTIATAEKQIKNIELISKVGLDLLDDKEQIVAQYRIKYRDASLLELSQIITLETNHKITKSGVNHRMKKITTLAEQIRRKENK